MSPPSHGADRIIQLPSERAASVRRLHWWWTVPIAVILLGLAVTWRWQRATTPDRDWHPVQQGSLTPIAVGGGVFIALQQRTLTVTEPGVVVELPIRNGAHVEPGTVIVRLRNPALDHELTDAEVAHRQSEEALLSAIAEARLSDLDADSALSHAERTLSAKRAELEAQRALLDKGGISKLQFARIEAEFELAKADVEAKRSMRSLRNELNRLRVEQAKQQEALQRERLERIRERQRQLTIRAESSGVLKDLRVELGHSVQSGQPLAVIGPEHPDAARLEFPQGQANQLRPGMTVNLEYIGRKADSKIATIHPQLENGYVTVEVEPAGSWEGAAIGMSVQARIAFPPIPNATYVAASASPIRRLGPVRVWRERNGQVELIDVRITDIVQEQLLLQGDLRAGDRLSFPSPESLP